MRVNVWVWIFGADGGGNRVVCGSSNDRQRPVYAVTNTGGPKASLLVTLNLRGRTRQDKADKL